MCLLLQLLQRLGFVLVVQVVEILCSFVCGAAASTRERTVSAELKRCFLLDAVCFLFFK